MWIKICGVNDPATMDAIVAAKPDAIGLNFYEPSARFVTRERAREIIARCPPSVATIGVFVDPTPEFVLETANACGLSGVQVHDALTADAFRQELSWKSARGPIRAIRAFAVGDSLSPLAEYAVRPAAAMTVDAWLVDAHVSGQRGGTGKTAPWLLLRNEYQTQQWPPLVLAGGLTPDNVAEAISDVRPWGVDVASGVESAPGVKDVERVANFIAEARRAFQSLAAGGK